jgi:hypothetical protein
MGKGKCEYFCQRQDFTLPILGKTLRDFIIDKTEKYPIKRCGQCEYVTRTSLRRCPCCNLQFSMRKVHGHDRLRYVNTI